MSTGPSARRGRPAPWAMSAALLLASAATACDRYNVCDPPDESQLAKLPARLSETGLYADVAAGAVSPDVLAFRPQFPLWSDGAEKRRWIWLPPGRRIDTSDMDSWSFPEGTRLWKDFTRDGTRVETRLLQKVGPAEDDWIGLAYLWDEAQTDAVAAPHGAVNALGTPHNVPASAECMACHGGRRSRALGFSAVQLAFEAEPGLVDLDDLAAAGLLSHPPASAPVIPGDATERAALGYIHANCGHCHNQARPSSSGARCFDPQNDLDFWLPAARLESVEDTPTYRTVGSTIEPGEPDHSPLITRFSSRNPSAQMPPLGTESVDQSALDLLRAWISGMR
jgi:hypothetical protein